MADTREREPEPQRFDDILNKLRGLVERLESGNLSLEESLTCFEQGMALCRRGGEILDGAEKKVEMLLAGPGKEGALKTAPFDAGGADANGNE